MLESEASFGAPQFERDGELVEGLDLHRTVPPLEKLLGKYVWAESGVAGDGTRGPQLHEGFELRVDNPQGPFEFPNVNGEISIFEGSGFVTGIQRAQPLVHATDGPAAWELEIDWPEDGDAMYPCQARIYVGKVLDDSGFPFLEVQFGDDSFQPYAYAKRQSSGGKAVGFSDAEKKRLNFVTNAMEQAERDRRDKERKEKAEVDKIKAATEKAKKQQEPQMSKGQRKRANKARRLEEERARLEQEESKFDLLKDRSAIHNHSIDLSKDHVSVSKGIKSETDVKKEIKDDRPPPSSSVKQEVFDAPLTQARGIKRERDEEIHTHEPTKRIKTEA